MKNLFALFLLSLVVIYACSTEELTNEMETIEVEIPTEFPAVTGEITASIRGRVSDVDNKGLEAATITCLSCASESSIEADEIGNFYFDNVRINGDMAFLKISYPGKFDCYRRLPLLADRDNYTSVKLRDKSLIGSMEASEGGSLEHTSGAEITLPQNGIVDAEGNEYNGRVDVYMSWIDPSGPNLQEMMMGDLTGIGSDNVVNALATFGMLQVELEDSEGRKLNLGDGESAELSFPVPASLLAEAQETIPLWSYNETHGYWVEEGQAILEGNTFIGEVSHFSTWNVDYKGTDQIEICGSLSAENRSFDSPIPYVRLELCGEGIFNTGGWVCDDGTFRFINVPPGEALTLKVYDLCDVLTETIEIPPSSTDIKLDPIVAQIPETINIVGTAINCDQQPVTEGFLGYVVNGEFGSYVNLESDGSFNFALINKNTSVVELQIFDTEAITESNPVTISELEDVVLLDNTLVCNETACLITDDLFVGDYEITFLLGPGNPWSTGLRAGIVTLELVDGFRNRRQFSGSVIDAFGGFPVNVTLDFDCSSVYLIPFTPGVGCGPPNIEYKTGTPQPIDVSDDSAIILEYIEDGGGCGYSNTDRIQMTKL